MFPNPVIFSLGFLSLNYYNLSYLIGFVWGSHLIRTHIAKNLNMDALLKYIVFGILLGGRLGHILFYDLRYHIAFPHKIFMTWEGGMSFHGGVLGVICALILFARKHNTPFLYMSNAICCVAPIGLCLGRIANFINQEIYGTPVSFGIVFPNVDILPRHPSQLYEAFAQGPVLGLIMYYLFKKKKTHEATFFFLIFYGVTRFFIEFTKVAPLTGQLLCLLMIAGGIFLKISTNFNIDKQKKRSI